MDMNIPVTALRIPGKEFARILRKEHDNAEAAKMIAQLSQLQQAGPQVIAQSGNGLNAAQQQALAAQQANMNARMGLIPSARTRTIDKWFTLPSQTITNYVSGQQMVLQFTPSPFGVLKRFVIKITATLVHGAAETQTRVSDGPANILSNVTYLDPANQPRTNCPGWLLHLAGTARRKRIFGAAYTTDTPTNMGSIYKVIQAPSSFTTSDSTFQMMYEVPIVYNDRDLRGLVNLNQINATQSLSVTLNPNFFVASGADPTFASYQSSTAQLGIISTLTVTVYQNCIDQITGLALPMQDIGTQYCLTQTLGGNPVVNQDQIMLYANNRSFFATYLRYDNTSVLNAGTDIAQFYIRAANGYNLLQADPSLVALWTRWLNGDDNPAGSYLFDHRHKPVTPNDYGNLALVANCNAVTGVNSVLYTGFEYMQLTSQLGQLSPLASAT